MKLRTIENVVFTGYTIGVLFLALLACAVGIAVIAMIAPSPCSSPRPTRASTWSRLRGRWWIRYAPKWKPSSASSRNAGGEPPSCEFPALAALEAVLQAQAERSGGRSAKE